MSLPLSFENPGTDFDLDKLKTFPGLSPRAFQLQADCAASEALEKFPLFPQLVRAIYSGFEEKVARLDQMSSSFRLGPNQGSSIYRLFSRAAEILDLATLPEIFLSGDFMVNATAFGVKRYMITLYAPLVSMLDEAELMAIIGHELGHVKCSHMANKTLAYYLGSFGAGTLASMIPGAGEVAAAALSLPLLHWSRMAELSCDRAALLVVQDPAIVARALSKLAGWSIPRLGELDLDEVTRQIKEQDTADPEMFDSLARIKHSMDTLSQTHPLPLLRMTRILQWGVSEQYKEIQRGRYPRI